jgi:hypothetical protein
VPRRAPVPAARAPVFFFEDDVLDELSNSVLDLVHTGRISTSLQSLWLGRRNLVKAQRSDAGWVPGANKYPGRSCLHSGWVMRRWTAFFGEEGDLSAGAQTRRVLRSMALK